MRWQQPVMTAALAALAALVLDAAPCSAQTAAQKRARAIQARNQTINNNVVVFNPGVNPFAPVNPFTPTVVQPFNPFLNTVFAPPVNPFFFNTFTFAPVGRPVGIRPVGIRPVYNRDLNLVTYPGANFFFFNNNFLNTPFWNPALNPFAGPAVFPTAFDAGNPFGFGRVGAFGLGGFGNAPFGNFAGFN